VLYRNKTGSTLILQSKLTGRPIPMGLFQPATSQQPEWFNYNHGPQNEEEVMGWGEASPSYNRTQQAQEDEQVPVIFHHQGSTVQEPGYRSVIKHTQHTPFNCWPSRREVDKNNFPSNREPAGTKEKRMNQPPIHQTEHQTSTKRNSDNLNMKTGSHGPNSTTGSAISTLVTQRQERHKANNKRQQGRPRTKTGPGNLPRQYQIPVLHSASNIRSGETTLDDQYLEELKGLS
jgi:hypothetical protein